MERIKQALELAQRQAAAAPAAASIAARVSRPGYADSGGDVSVTYTETRRIPLSASVMEKHRLIAGSGKDAVTSAYKVLRTQVLQRLKGNNWNALAVVSAKHREGKSVTAVNLAISLAQEVTHTVLLVDLNLHDPTLHRFFDYHPPHGLSDYLTNGVALKEVLFNPGIDRLVVLPAGSALANSSEMLSSPKMTALVDELKARYPSRIVLFDLPPLLSSDDALAFAPYVDAALLVIQDGATDRDELMRAMSLLGETPVIGSVLNKYTGHA